MCAGAFLVQILATLSPIICNNGDKSLYLSICIEFMPAAISRGGLSVY